MTESSRSTCSVESVTTRCWSTFPCRASVREPPPPRPRWWSCPPTGRARVTWSTTDSSTTTRPTHPTRYWRWVNRESDTGQALDLRCVSINWCLTVRLRVHVPGISFRVHAGFTPISSGHWPHFASSIWLIGELSFEPFPLLLRVGWGQNADEAKSNSCVPVNWARFPPGSKCNCSRKYNWKLFVFKKDIIELNAEEVNSAQLCLLNGAAPTQSHCSIHCDHYITGGEECKHPANYTKTCFNTNEPNLLVWSDLKSQKVLSQQGRCERAQRERPLSCLNTCSSVATKISDITVIDKYIQIGLFPLVSFTWRWTCWTAQWWTTPSSQEQVESQSTVWTPTRIWTWLWMNWACGSSTLTLSTEETWSLPNWIKVETTSPTGLHTFITNLIFNKLSFHSEFSGWIHVGYPV